MTDPTAAPALALPVQLTNREAAACLRRLSAAIPAAGGVLAIDAAPLAHFDSAALAVLLGLRRACAQRGARLQVRGWPSHLRELAQIYGVAELLTAPA